MESSGRSAQLHAANNQQLISPHEDIDVPLALQGKQTRSFRQAVKMSDWSAVGCDDTQHARFHAHCASSHRTYWT